MQLLKPGTKQDSNISQYNDILTLPSHITTSIYNQYIKHLQNMCGTFRMSVQQKSGSQFRLFSVFHEGKQENTHLKAISRDHNAILFSVFDCIAQATACSNKEIQMRSRTGNIINI